MRTLLVWVSVLLLTAPSALAQKKADKPAPAKKKAKAKPAKKKLPAPTHAYTGMWLYDGTGKLIPNAVILVGKGKIVAVGTAGKLKIPAGVKTVNWKGKRVIPGLIDASSRLFLASGSESRGSSTLHELKDGLDLFDRNARAALARGVTSVHLAPVGSQFGGQGVLVKLSPDGEQTGKVALSNTAITATYVLRSGSSATPAQYLSVYDKYKSKFEQAEDYKEKWDKYNKKLEKYKKALAAWEKKEKARKAAALKKKKAAEAKKKAALKKAAEAKKKAADAKKKAADAKKKGADAKKKGADAKKKGADAKKKQPVKKAQPKKAPAAKPAKKSAKPKKKQPAKGAKKSAKPKIAPKPKEPKKPKEKKKIGVLMRILEGKRTLMLLVDSKEDIESALKLAQRFKLKLTLVGATEAYLVADKIKKGGHRVMLRPAAGPDIANVGRMLRTSDAASKLAKAGIPTAIGSHGSGRATRYMRFYLLQAIAAGLPTKKALQTVTRDAAVAVGVESRVGSIAPGKDADFVLLSGHPFSLQTKVEQVYIDGKLAYRRQK